MFPSNVVGGMFGFKQRDLLSTPESEKQPVKVAF
jgi:hypothetical protein